jgi:lycopene cyclase CruA
MAARYGRRVMVFDRSEVGCAHREWNISRTELAALVESGVVSWDELDTVVMREYRDGLVRFHSRPHSDAPPVDLWLPEVLNVALDAGALLRLMRRKLEDAGGTVLSGRLFRRVCVRAGAPLSVEVELTGPDGATERYKARLLLDGMGSTSPLALLRHAGRPFAGVCPTVGTVARGFAQGDGPQEYDPTLGDILVSVADSQGGEQMMWEGFPGRGDELTIYLFYYSAIRRASTRDYSMLDLFEQYFTLLPTYKRPGPGFRHIKPVYGYIPARHSLRPQEAPLLRGVLPVGDSAAQQSPLTFCGFGSHVRNLRRTTGLLDYALRHNLLDPNQLAPINAFQANVSLNWIFSRFMEPWDQADDVNRLQNLFIRVLHEMGVEKATRFFQDRMRWQDYHPMLLGMMWHYPGILLAAWKVLGIKGITQWMGDYARFSWAAATAALARVGGRRAEQALTGLAERLAPALGLRLRARYAEWRSMGWVA